MLTLTWAPSGGGPDGGSPSSRPSTAGATLANTWRAVIVRPSAGRHRRPRSPSVRTPTTSTPVTSSAPRFSAAAASCADTVPMPPTGTSQWPVPPPTTWYRKQRLASRSWAWVNVPISASVSTMPRTVSSAKCSLDQLADRPLDERPPRRRRRRGGGSRRRCAAARSASGTPARRRRRRRVQLVPAAASAPRPRVAAGSAASTRTPPSPTGVYDETSRRRSVTSRPSSSTICAGSRLTRYEYFDSWASWAGNTRAERAAPPTHRGALEHEHRPPGLGEVRRARQPVVPAADDDGVVPVHGFSLR